MRPNRWATDPQLIQFVELKLLLWVFRNVMNGLVLLMFSINSNSRTTTIHSHLLPIGCWWCDVRLLCTDTWPRFLQWNEGAIRRHIHTMCMCICYILYAFWPHVLEVGCCVLFFFCLSPNHKLSGRVLWLNIVKQLLLIFFLLHCVYWDAGGGRNIFWMNLVCDWSTIVTSCLNACLCSSECHIVIHMYV